MFLLKELGVHFLNTTCSNKDSLHFTHGGVSLFFPYQKDIIVNTKIKLTNIHILLDILFINQNDNPENLLARIKSLKQMQRKGKHDQVPPMPMDNKDFGIGAQILHDIGITRLKVISNSKQQRRIAITGYGISIEGYKSY